MKVTGEYQYPDNRPGDVDAFSREPFVVRFKAPKTGEFSDTLLPTLRKRMVMFMHENFVSLHPPFSPTPIYIFSYKGVYPHTSAHHSSQHHEGAWCAVWRVATCEEDVEVWGTSSKITRFESVVDEDGISCCVCVGMSRMWCFSGTSTPTVATLRRSTGRTCVSLQKITSIGSFKIRLTPQCDPPPPAPMTGELTFLCLGPRVPGPLSLGVAGLLTEGD